MRPLWAVMVVAVAFVAFSSGCNGCGQPLIMSLEDAAIALATCNDRKVNQDESDEDCGGKLCQACDVGQKCRSDADCAQLLCGANKHCGCGDDSDCDPNLLPFCTPAGVCVGCQKDADCGPFGICAPGSFQCAPGCSATRPCAAGQLCDLDIGQCVECLVDGDCTHSEIPFCDPFMHACSVCVPGNDTCAPLTYCESDGSSANGCVAGCKSDSECQYSDGDGGTITGYCDLTDHTCHMCKDDNSCEPGKLCVNETCVDGCTSAHPCASGFECCGPSPKCADTMLDINNCGGCGIACNGGYNCCGGKCSNPTTDPENCGRCGKACPSGRKCGPFGDCIPI